VVLDHVAHVPIDPLRFHSQNVIGIAWRVDDMRCQDDEELFL
jgi:hypothetical protein